MPKYCSIVSMSSLGPPFWMALLMRWFPPLASGTQRSRGSESERRPLGAGLDPQDHHRVGAQPADVAAPVAGGVVGRQVGGAVDADEQEVLRRVARRSSVVSTEPSVTRGSLRVLRVHVGQPAGGEEQRDASPPLKQRSRRSRHVRRPRRPSVAAPTDRSDHWTGRPSSRLITSRCTSLVPSPISRILASR